MAASNLISTLLGVPCVVEIVACVQPLFDASVVCASPVISASNYDLEMGALLSACLSPTMRSTVHDYAVRLIPPSN